MYKHEVTIRAAIPEDAPFMAALAAELAAHEGESSRTTTDTIIRDGFGDAPRCRYIVAAQHNTVIGMCMFYQGYDLVSANSGLHLGDIIVTKHHRGKGIGQLLFQELCNIAKAESYAWMSWTLSSNNQTAHAFYKKMGAVDVPVKFMAMGQTMMSLLVDV